MDGRGEQGFVGINVADTADKGLVEKKSFDGDAALLQAFEEFVEGDLQSVGADSCEGGRQGGKKLDAAKLADVVIDQRTAIEMEIGAGVFAAVGVPQEFPRHAEVDVEDATIEFNQDLFAMTADPFNAAAGEGGGGFSKATACDAVRVEFGVVNRAADNVGRDGADDGFDFGEFGQSFWGGGE